eukprot:3938523-Rhodomonas_salina.1
MRDTQFVTAFRLPEPIELLEPNRLWLERSSLKSEGSAMHCKHFCGTGGRLWPLKSLGGLMEASVTAAWVLGRLGLLPSSR